MRRFGGIGVAWFVATVVAVTIAAAAVGSVRSEVTDVPTVLGVSVSPSITILASDELSNPRDDGSDLERTSRLTLAPVVESVTSEPPVVESVTSEPSTVETSTTIGPPATDQAVAAETHTHQEGATKSLPQGGSTSSAPTTQTVTTPTNPPTTKTTTAGTATTTTTPPPPPPPPPPNAPTATTSPAPTSEAYTRMIDTDGGAVSVRVDGDAVVFRRAFPKSGWRFDLANAGPETVEARFTNIDDRSLRIKVRVTVIDGTLDISITPPN